MNQKAVNTKKAPKALGPYSQAICVGNMVFTSGQIPIDPATGEVVDGAIEEQARQCLENLKAVLKKAGSSLKNTVKSTVYIKNMNDFPALNEVYAAYFQKPYPARSCVEVARLPKDVLCEIELIALIKK